MSLYAYGPYPQEGSNSVAETIRAPIKDCVIRYYIISSSDYNLSQKFRKRGHRSIITENVRESFKNKHLQIKGMS